MIDHVYVFIVCPKSDQPVCICPSIRALNNVKHIYIYIRICVSLCLNTITRREQEDDDEEEENKKTKDYRLLPVFFLSPPITLSFCSMIFSLFRYTMIASRFDLHSRLNSYQFI